MKEKEEITIQLGDDKEAEDTLKEENVLSEDTKDAILDKAKKSIEELDNLQNKEEKEGDTNIDIENNINTEAIEEDNEDDIKVGVKDLLNSFKAYVHSDEFDNACEEKSKEHNVNKDKVKFSFIKNFGITVAKVLNIAISLVGNTIRKVLHFIDVVISNITSFASSKLALLVGVLAK